MGEQVRPLWAGLPISESHDVQPQWTDWRFFVTPSMPHKPKELAAPRALLADEETKVLKTVKTLGSFSNPLGTFAGQHSFIHPLDERLLSSAVRQASTVGPEAAVVTQLRNILVPRR